MYLRFWYEYVRGPSPVPESSYSVVYTASFAKVIISIMAVIALVASAVRVGGDALTDLEDGHFRSDSVDRTYEFVSESDSVIFDRKVSLNEREKVENLDHFNVCDDVCVR